MQTMLLAEVQWGQVGVVLGVFAAIAVLLTVCILLVAKFCKTNADEKVESILSHLAGANCGGCGCTGCAGFAEKLARGEATLSDCHVTESDQKAQIAQILGVPYAAEQKKLAGGHKACKYGCLGDGNCTRVCPENAVCIQNGCAEVGDRCISCGACMLACPQKLFDRIPADAKVYVACSSHDRGKAVMDVCKVGCIGCGKCAKVCPQGAVTMQDNLPVIDYTKCIGCGKCAESCPRGSIRTR